MSAVATQICQQLETLEDQERLTVMRWLWDHMGPAFVQELDSEEEEIAELERRSNELSSGAVKGITLEEFWGKVEESKLERLAATA
jgi:putative addiction module component (TIGR02574 family)